MARYGWHIHSRPVYNKIWLSADPNDWIPDPNDPRNLTLEEVISHLDSAGGTALRMDTTGWHVYQPNAPIASHTAFNPNALTMNTADYNTYLANRGYASWNGTPGFDWIYQPIAYAASKDIKTVYNFGVTPDWAKVAPPPGVAYGIDAPADPTYVGKFFADLIIYFGRQGAAGITALKSVEAWQIYNEINNVYGGPNDVVPVDQTPWDSTDNNYTNVALRPYNEYFATMENAMSLIKQAYAAINWSTASGGAVPPPVAGPTLAGAYDPAFWRALFDYVPTLNDPSLLNSAGNLAITSATLHPYGARVDVWDMPDTRLNPNAPDPLNVGAAGTNLSYGRMLLPTDDYLTWKSMTERDDSGGSNLYNLYLYSSVGNNSGDEYFSRNAEIGMERTMSRLDDEGYGSITINLTEWGASTYVGDDTQTGFWSLINTTFADPFKYGYVAQGDELSVIVAENLQAETIAQTLGLIETWDFVGSATPYEIFDQDNSSYQGQFGLAYGVNADGTINYKMAGLALNAYMAGTAYNSPSTILNGSANNTGVNIHIQATGVSGTFSSAVREAEVAGDTLVHEVVLLRDGNDTFDGLNGDDIAFGGSGNDTLTGGNGYDRLYGGSGDDSLNGGADDDRIKGDSGNDTLTGGSGKDAFVFSAYNTTGTGYAGDDTITDFVAGTDTIMLIGGYTTGVLLNNASYPNLVTNVGGGVKIIYADNGASITLTGYTEASLTASMFLVYEGDTSVGYTPPGGGGTINGTSGADTLNGTASAETINGLGGNDSIFGLGGNDTINGGDGDDWLIGGAGADVINGGLGWDLLEYYDSAAAVTVNMATGTGSGGDAAGDTFTGIETLSGSAYNDTLTGDANYNNIWGGLGDDTIAGGGDTDNIWAGDGADTLFGEAGNDALYGDAGDDFLIGGAGADTIDGGLGFDLLSYFDATSSVTVSLATGSGSLGDAQGDVLANIEALAGSNSNDTLTGDANYNNIWGNAGADTIDGGGFSDSIWGGDGNDTINGGSGDDNLYGNLGDDTFIVDSALDSVIEVAGEGNDLIQSSVTIAALAANVERLTLTGSAALNGTGNSLNNTLTGNTGNNTLNGGAGVDTLIGGNGNDTYVVDTTTDIITETTPGGTDTIQSSVTITTLAANVENLTLTGSAAINGTGNTLANVITGNTANNTLNGGDGNDTLNGGAGVDTLVGGNGNDTYVVDTTTDVITETSTGGTDTVQSSVTFTLGSNVERLTLTGTANIDGTGNTLANIITGNSGNNFIAGGAGADTLNGGAGYDLVEYYGSAAAVTVNLTLATAQSGGDAAGDILSNFEAIGGSNVGNDTLTGNASDNGIWGNGGNDTITGGGGNDTLAGGLGNDTFVFATGFGTDQVNDFTAGAGVADRLRLLVGTTFDTYAEVYAATTQVGANSVINMGAIGSITLLNVTKTTLVADDFVFT